MTIAILCNETVGSGDKWLIACKRRGIDADVIDLTGSDALQKVLAKKYDMFLLRPPGMIERYKTLYDERLYHILRTAKVPAFPSFLECFIYENKRNLSSFLFINRIPHPQTWVIYHYQEALSFINSTSYPIVAKTTIGATGSGVKIIRTKHEANVYVYRAFKGSGIRRKFGPNRMVGSPRSWVHKAISKPRLLISKITQYTNQFLDVQRGFVFLQEYIDHDYEWRVVKIGESYFAYKKFRVGDKASGAKKLGYDNPPLSLLDFIRIISEKTGIRSAAYDIFDRDGEYLVNEIQTIFGHVREHILEVEGKPGRYLYQNGAWVFEEGKFNSNESYDLRLDTALQLYNKGEL